MAEPEPEVSAGGTELPELLDWFRAQPGCKLGSVEITTYEYEGRGVKAAAAVKKGNPLFSCPIKLLVSAAAARAEPTLGPVFAQLSLRDDDILALFLLHERRKGAASAHAQHIASLPTSYDQTIFWSPEEMAEIQGSNVFGITAQLLVQIKEDYETLQAALGGFAAVAVADFSLADYFWALATIWSRSMDLPVPGESGATTTMRIIAPVADMFNTRPGQPQVHGYMRDLDALTVAASEDTRAGEQLFIGYGSVTNARAMWLYGFASDNNPNDTVELFACMDTEAPSYEKRMKLLKALGLSEKSTSKPHALSLSDPLPKDLLLSLRVQHAPKKLIRQWRDDPEAFSTAKKPPDAALERTILDALRAGCVGMLESYSTSLEEDEEAAERWAAHTQSLAAVSGYRRRMALLLRLGEKRILRATIKAIDGAFNALNFVDLDEEPALEPAPVVAPAEEGSSEVKPGEANGYGTVAVDLAAEAEKAKETMKALRKAQMDKPPPVAMKRNPTTGEMEKFESSALKDDLPDEEAETGEIQIPVGDDY